MSFYKCPGGFEVRYPNRVAIGGKIIVTAEFGMIWTIWDTIWGVKGHGHGDQEGYFERSNLEDSIEESFLVKSHEGTVPIYV